MATAHVEVESKFDVAPDFSLGDLTSLIPPAGHLQTNTVELVSVYWDTPALALLGSRLTLRRRTGGDDSGWHLKVPGAGFRTELHWPLDDNSWVPDELASLIRPFVHGNAVRPVVELRVIRTRTKVLAEDGSLVLEIADDEVRANGLNGVEPAMSRWREVEAELGPSGSDDDLENVSEVLLSRGAFPSASRSKLARALQGNHRAVGAASGTAGELLRGYIARQCDAITAGHFAISMKPFEPDSSLPPHEAVHQTRVATRRLRALLRTFGSLFDPERASRLEGELKWFAGELGEVRDREVLRHRLAQAVADLPPDLVTGPVAKRIDDILLAELGEHARLLIMSMQDARYGTLLADLSEWSASPPFTEPAAKPARTLNAQVVAAEKKLEKRMRQAAKDDVPDAKLHAARKQGKRVRYAAEAAGPALGHRARHLVKSAERLQTLLGEHQDSIVAAQLLRRVADQAAEDGENTFTYGILVGEQRRVAQQSAEAARRATRP